MNCRALSLWLFALTFLVMTYGGGVIIATDVLIGGHSVSEWYAFGGIVMIGLWMAVALVYTIAAAFVSTVSVGSGRDDECGARMGATPDVAQCGVQV